MHVPSPPDVVAFLATVRAAVEGGRIEIREYALDGMRELEWTAFDVRMQLLELGVADFLRTEESTAPQGGLVWTFTPEFWDDGYLWIRLVERTGIVIISFHKG